IFDRRRITYGEIETCSNRLAHALIAQGLQHGDRVAIWLENSPDVAIALFAVLKAGGVFLVLNSTTKGDKAEHILNDCRARALFTDGHRAHEFRGHWSAVPHLEFVWSSEASLNGDIQTPGKSVASLPAALADEGLPARPPEKGRIDIDLAALIYTSGSTGKPKGVMLTHRNMVSAAISITTYLENTCDDIILSTLPLSFDYGLYQVLMAFLVGATLLLEPSFAFPHRVLEVARRERVTGLPIVPTISALLLQMDLSRYDLSSLRYITNTAAALPAEHIRRLRDLLPRVRIYSMYGLTECKRVSYLPPDQIDVRPTSVGRGMPNEEVYVVDERGCRVGPGIVGELVVRGSNVMKGYWEDPAETAKCLRPGRYPSEKVLYTGDLFKTDSEGYLYFVGRKDEMIKSRGEKVSPREIEEVLYSLDGVVEAAVVGVPDPVLGQAIKVFITRRAESKITERAVLQHCAQRLEDFMVPRAVEFHDCLPKTPSGKIDKREMVQ
ncbi:MAG TPA: AMP-binding protein, partial [Geobacterales bacterium]|nr:AMP-binding protein [Geobacterales bacterium]